jgi:hypothetical protein
VAPQAVVVTPAKGVWYCWAAREGGGLIALAAHIRKCDVRDAAKWLDSGKSEQPKEVRPNGTLEPLPYIEHEHPAVEALGLSPDDAKALGVGYSPKAS